VQEEGMDGGEENRVRHNMKRLPISTSGEVREVSKVIYAIDAEPPPASLRKRVEGNTRTISDAETHVDILRQQLVRSLVLLQDIIVD
jgi:hypothetical protein